jgi:hypothetical protein
VPGINVLEIDLRYKDGASKFAEQGRMPCRVELEGFAVRAAPTASDDTGGTTAEPPSQPRDGTPSPAGRLQKGGPRQ